MRVATQPETAGLLQQQCLIQTVLVQVIIVMIAITTARIMIVILGATTNPRLMAWSCGRGYIPSKTIIGIMEEEHGNYYSITGYILGLYGDNGKKMETTI